MGVNKENVRYVIHFHLPGQMEAYVQEMGRAGRDGRNSIAILLYTHGDEDMVQSLIEAELPTEEQIRLFVEQGSSAQTLCSMIGISDVQWRLLQYMLEKEQACAHPTEEIIANLLAATEARRRWKRNKLQQMRSFLLRPLCRREQIVSYFQQHLAQKPAICCDVCGLSLEQYKKLAKEPHPRAWTFRGWEEELKRMFF